jgi:hypothetical protein
LSAVDGIGAGVVLNGAGALDGRRLVDKGVVAVRQKPPVSDPASVESLAMTRGDGRTYLTLNGRAESPELVTAGAAMPPSPENAPDPDPALLLPLPPLLAMRRKNVRNGTDTDTLHAVEEGRDKRGLKLLLQMY